MKVVTRVLFPALLLLMLLVACQSYGPYPSAGTSAASEVSSRVITVTGDAEVKVVPDEVILTLGVETWDKDLKVAKDRNDEIVRKVLKLAADYGIDPKHLQTDYISIEPRYEDDYERSDFIGFFVRNTVVVTLRDTAKFEDLLTDMLTTGVTHVHGIEFRTTELRRYRDEARALAIHAAQEKAQALAGELGQHLGEPTSISEDQSGWWSWYSSWWGSRWGSPMSQNVSQSVGEGSLSEDSTIAPGQIAVNARVTVTFALE